MSGRESTGISSAIEWNIKGKTFGRSAFVLPANNGGTRTWWPVIAAMGADKLLPVVEGGFASLEIAFPARKFLCPRLRLHWRGVIEGIRVERVRRRKRILSEFCSCHGVRTAYDIWGARTNP